MDPVRRQHKPGIPAKLFLAHVHVGADPRAPTTFVSAFRIG